MTFTLITRDPDTGDIGLAIASRWPAVGAVVPYYRRDVGVVASQSYAHAAMAEAVLDTLAEGVDPDVALDVVLPEYTPEHRQVLVMTHGGTSTLRTGSDVQHEISEARGADCIAAGNMLANAGVASAMVDRYLKMSGAPFADRLLAALRSGEAAGGDRRGREAAALRIWPTRYPDPVLLPFDLRADNDPDPIAVLERTLAQRRMVEKTRY